MEDFDVTYTNDEVSDTTIITTSEKVKQMLQSALDTYDPQNEKYAVYLNEGSSNVTITFKEIEQLAITPQSDLQKILKINSVVRFFINVDH